MDKKANTRSNIIIGIIIVLIISSIGFAMVNTSQNDSNLDDEQLQTALLEAFNSLNLTLTNVYVNETYLNQTFITNEEYVTNVDNRTYNEFITQVTNQVIEGLEPIEIGSNTIITLSENNYSEIDFYVRNTMINAISDNLGLNMVDTLEYASNLNIENSFFIDYGLNIVENNVLVEYDNFNSGGYLIDDNNDFFRVTFNNTLTDKNIYVNMAHNPASKTAFAITEDSIDKFQVTYVNTDSVRLENLETGELSSIMELPENCDGNLEFCMYRVKIEEDFVKLYVRDHFVGQIEANLSNTNSIYELEGRNTNNNDVYLKGMYVQAEEINVIPATYSIGSDSFDIDSNVWEQVNIKITPNTVYYTIGDDIQSVDNLGNYSLNIDLTKTDIGNLFGKVQ